MISFLKDLPRVFPGTVRLNEVGWMTDHRSAHRNNRLPCTYFCLSFPKEGPEKNAHFSCLPYGTVLNAPLGELHDELFFAYSPENADRLAEMLGRGGKRFSVRPEIGDSAAGLIREIGRACGQLYETGMADRLDSLALRLISELLLSRSGGGRGPELRLEEAASALEKGEPLEKILKKYSFSRRTFYREWEKFFSVSPSHYLLAKKLEKASALLLSGGGTVKEIAQECGFSSSEYFSRVFSGKYGMTPGSWRKRGSALRV